MRSEVSARAGGLAGALCVVCSAAAPAEAQSPPAGFELADATLVHQQPARVAGTLAQALAGQMVALEFRADGAQAWRRLGARRVRADGRYRLARRVPGSGTLRVTAADGAFVSGELRVRVAAGLTVASRRLNVAAGRHAKVSGVVRPGGAGLGVSLQVRRAGRWATIDRDRTGASGRYTLADRRTATMSSPARLRLSGSAAGTSTRALGRLNVYRSAYASWYGPGLYGNRLGCGGTLGAGTLGVAHKSLPCGTKVTFRRGGRTLRVPVIDRGPYVGGREYDLTAATAQRLGFRGHGAIQATR